MCVSINMNIIGLNLGVPSGAVRGLVRWVVSGWLGGGLIVGKGAVQGVGAKSISCDRGLDINERSEEPPAGARISRARRARNSSVTNTVII